MGAQGEGVQTTRQKGAVPVARQEKGGGVGADFLGANLMGFLPEGRVAKVHPAKMSCVARVQVWEGPLSLVQR